MNSSGRALQLKRNLACGSNRPSKRRSVAPVQYWVMIDNILSKMTHLDLLNLDFVALKCSVFFICRENCCLIPEEDAFSLFTLFRNSKKPAGSTPNSSARCPNGSSNNDSEGHDLGYWASFCSLQEVGDVWRSTINAHVVTRKFGRVILLTTTPFGEARPKSNIPDLFTLSEYYNGQKALYGDVAERNDCALVIPCQGGRKPEIERIGINFMKNLRQRDPIYYCQWSKTPVLVTTLRTQFIPAKSVYRIVAERPTLSLMPASNSTASASKRLGAASGLPVPVVVPRNVEVSSLYRVVKEEAARSSAPGGLFTAAISMEGCQPHSSRANWYTCMVHPPRPWLKEGNELPAASAFKYVLEKAHGVVWKRDH